MAAAGGEIMARLPICKLHSDCFASKDKRCIALSDTGFKGHDCPFYKTQEQADAEKAKSLDRLQSMSRYDLIERYKPEKLMGVI